MESTEPTRNGYHRIDSVQEPEDRSGRSRTHAWVSVVELELCYKHNKWKANNLRAAREVLENPDRVFKHIRPGEAKAGWCYSKTLSQVWSADGIRRVPARPGTVFTVYLNSDCSIFEWGADENDLEDPDSPAGARKRLGTPRGRFGELVWERR